MNRIRAVLASSRLPFFAAGLALALTLPALWQGFQVDDLAMRVALLEHLDSFAEPSEAFSFITGDPETNREYRNLGFMPWWASEDLRFVFLRPLTIAFHRLDYALWPDSAALMHLHSLLWLAALVLSLAALYRRLLTPAWVAGLATLLYAIDDSHGFPAAWLANRNALIATTLGVLALVFHDRWRREDSRPGLWLALLFLAGALFAAELGSGALAYLFAYALFVEGRWETTAVAVASSAANLSPVAPTEPLMRRLLTLAPYAAVAMVWLLVHKLGGYGTAGSGYYVDPFRQTSSFLWALVERAPILLLGQWALPQADTYLLARGAEAVILWLRSVGMILLLVLLLTPLLRRSPVARFWALGMMISLVPICATAPSNRLLSFVGIGGMGLLAQFLGGMADQASWRPRARPWRWLSWGMVALLVAVHLVVAPLLLPFMAVVPSILGEPARAAALSLPDDDSLADQDLVIVNSPDYLLYVAYMLPERMLRGLPIPRHVRALSAMPVPAELTRSGESSVLIRYSEGPFVGPTTALWRSIDQPMYPGHVVELEGMTVEVLASTEAGEPREVEFRFELPLEDQSFRWVSWSDGLYVPFALPEIGETIDLAAPLGPTNMQDPAELWAAYRVAVQRNAGR